MTRKKDDLTKRYVRTMQALATISGTSYSTVRADWKNAGLPREEDGTYDLFKVGMWLGARRGGRIMTETQGENPMTGPSLRRKEVDVLIKEQELKAKERANALAEGDYVPRTDVERYFAAIFSRFRDDLSRVPMEMKASFPKNVREHLVAQIKDRLDLVLTTIHRQKRKIEEMVGKE